MYQALYRKWRPKTFSDVVGQAHITETLRAQVAEGRTSHAYLFTGTRGTGKTTCAKILAKAVNCQNPEDGNPCCKCPACLGIENGSFLDVLELDAASNNGVDQVRALRDEAIYAPANVKKRVYIIDEVHMLTLPAFNALLKILEEPPAHLMFILATTELHKVPATILSRCQRFSFKRIQPPDIAQRLSYVASQEKISLTADGAELLSRLADGALRDALSLLDQCAASGSAVDSREILEVLGLAGNLQTAELMEHIARRDAGSALALLDRLYTGGKDVGAVLGELSALARDLLLRTAAPKGGLALLSGGCDLAALDRLQKEDLSAPRLLYMTSELQHTLSDLYFSSNRRTDAELCLLRLCDESLSGDLTALDARMDRLEKRMDVLPAAIRSGGEPALAQPAREKPAPVKKSPAGRGPAAPPEKDSFESPPLPGEEDAPPWEEPPAPEAPPSEAPAIVPDTPESAPEPDAPGTPAIAPERSDPPIPEQPPAEAAAPSGDGAGVWQELAEICKGGLPAMYRAFLDMCRGTLCGGIVTVYAPDDMTRGRLDNDRVLGVLGEKAAALSGAPVQVRIVVGTGPESSPEDRRKKLIDFGSQFDSVKIK
ncbi:MAG: DNA polymerase III subunit gamma/tau [Oscillibacter sp.]|jgi:DNA polymerase-3 subunit gamma/tau|nr:DNA polymerase III subunit gamma/tau [Oscillibacter sp.]